MKLPPRNPQEIAIGKIKDAHGLRGEVYLLVFAWLRGIPPEPLTEIPETLQLVSPSGEEKQFKVLAKALHKDGARLKLAGVLDRNASEALKGYSWVRNLGELKSQPGEALYLVEVLGFQVFLQKESEGPLGLITGFSNNGVQDLLVVESKDGKKTEVPFVEAFVQNIDYEKKQIVLNLPENYLEIF